MNLKLLRVPFFLVATFLFILLLFRGCGYCFWSEQDIDRNVDVFIKNRNSFNSLVAWDDKKSRSCLKTNNYRSCLPNELNEITKDGFCVSYDPFIVEASPVNFYYVLVYTKQPEDTKKADAYRDEGKIVKEVDRNWTLVRRGFV
ncbi:hypothetical protein [Pseudanabaena yagii]|uniref:Lipoprotein n=1 Tax=Pseudanabaena yagii GIHE-NHR1 TaxID=2722753 RepID=A0ABX1LTD8_9CYAN|nr:hypothetical protein [Pseudanabaena yagii]NMF59389.1 hypothetical protein [Pseudanabaena yagii GIHE-NHR1]